MDQSTNAHAAEAATPQQQVVVAEPPKFDLESYIANYEGLTQLDRLLTIGTSSRFLGLESLKAAVQKAKQGKDVNKYAYTTQLLHALAPQEPLSIPDTDWIEAKQMEVKSEGAKLEQELKGYRNNLIKESIRMGNEDLGAFYYAIGDYPSAYKAYSRMREYCTTPKHIAEMSLKLILVGIAQENWMVVQSNVHKIQHLQLRPEDKEKIDPVHEPLLGLAHLATANYRAAAAAFFKADPGFLAAERLAGIQFNKQVLTANDVAVYGGLTALATMDRADLTSAVLENASFRQFLELEPHIRRAINCFVGSKFTACLEILEAYRADYLLDVYLQRHVRELYGLIRRKSIVQYFVPFSRVSLSVMAAAFRVSEQAMEDELVAMIGANLLDARVDLVERLLVANSEDEREKVQTRALEMAGQQERALRLKLWRINMLNAGFELRANKQSPLEGKSVGMRGMGGRGKWEV